MHDMIMGAIAIGWWVCGLFFFRFWRRTKDPFFLWFALSFWIEAVNRIALGLVTGANENSPAFYGVRIVSYGLILFAIVQKNRPRS